MKKVKPPRLVVVATITTITIVFWVFYGLYNVITSTPNPTVANNILEPISPELDTNALDKLPDRVFFEEQEIETIINLTPTPTPTPELEEEVETASPTATLTPSP